MSSIFIGSQQTQHVALHKVDLDHVRQLTRSIHGGTKEEKTTINLLLWTRSPGMNYSRITLEADMVMKRTPVMIPLSGRVPGIGARGDKQKLFLRELPRSS